MSHAIQVHFIYGLELACARYFECKRPNIAADGVIWLLMFDSSHWNCFCVLFSTWSRLVTAWQLEGNATATTSVSASGIYKMEFVFCAHPPSSRPIHRRKINSRIFDRCFQFFFDFPFVVKQPSGRVCFASFPLFDGKKNFFCLK